MPISFYTKAEMDALLVAKQPVNDYLTVLAEMGTTNKDNLWQLSQMATASKDGLLALAQMTTYGPAVVYYGGTNDPQMSSLTPIAKSLLAAETAEQMRTILGL